MRIAVVAARRIAAVILCGSFCCLPAVKAYGADWQFWQGGAVNRKINDKVSLAVSYEMRDQNSGKDWFTSLAVVNPMVKLSKSISAGPIYYFIPTKQADGSVKDENRYGFVTNYSWTEGMFKLGYRLLYEYRDYRVLAGGHENRIRHRFQVAPDIKAAKRFLSPAVSYEVFYSFTKNDFLQTRACVGNSFAVYPGLALNIQYVLRQDKSGSAWTGVNVLGSYLSYSL